MSWMVRLGLLSGLISWLGMAMPGPSYAEFHGGGGMEYFTTKLALQAEDRSSFMTLLQTTLALAAISWETPDYRVQLVGGYSDWNVGGSWENPNHDKYSTEPFAYTWQKKISVEGYWQMWQGLGLGARFSDHQLEHYTYLSYRAQVWELQLGYALYHSQAVRIELAAAYSPRMLLTIDQNVPVEFFYSMEPGVFHYDSSGFGSRWAGELKIQYLDSAGWGVDVQYQLSRASFHELPTIPKLTITSGNLAGCLFIRF